LTVVVALALLLGAYAALKGSALLRRTFELDVQFANAQGIAKGTDVRLSGVRIGEVKEVELAPSRRAIVTLLIDQKYRTEIGTDDRIAIATGGLLPTPYIEITPARTGPPDQDAFVGQSAVTTDEILSRFNDLLPESKELVRSLSSLSRSLESVVGDPSVNRNWKNTAANLEASSARGKQIMANLERASRRGDQFVANLEGASRTGAPRLDRAMASLERAGLRLERTMAEFQTAVGENRPKIGETLDNLSGAMAALQEVLDQVKETISDEETRKNLRETLASLQQAMANLREASANLAEATDDVKQLTGDPKFNEDLKATVAESRSTMEEAGILFRRLNRIAGSGGEEGSRGSKPLRSVGVRADLLYRTKPGRARLDLDATLPARRGYYRFGLYDFSESTHLNLQLGQRIRPGQTLRFGLHASKLGLGLDLGAMRRPWLEVDLYGLEDPSLDVRAAGRLSDALDLTLGLDHLFGTNAPIFGVRWRF
jgi:phospholipid/cholesterol/gamma-HCH transport system substrate-binding protein